MNFQEFEANGLLRELAQCVTERMQAKVILTSISFPRASLPTYPRGENWMDFWMKVVDAIRNGQLESGPDLQPLVNAIARALPGNALFQRFAVSSTEAIDPQIEIETERLIELYRNVGFEKLKPDLVACGINPESIASALKDEKLFYWGLNELDRSDLLTEIFAAALLRWPDDPALREEARPIIESFDHPRKAAGNTWHSRPRRENRETLERVWSAMRGRPEAQEETTPSVKEPPKVQRPISVDFSTAQGFEPQVVLLTANERERQAAFDRMKSPDESDERLWRFTREFQTYFLGYVGKQRVVTLMTEQGTAAAMTTRDAIELWKPRAIIMAGVAFGVDPEKQAFGDVLVGEQIIHYEVQRVGEDETIQRGPIVESSPRLRNRFQNAIGWSHDREDGTSCRVIRGALLSGEKLVDNVDFRESLVREFPRAIGGEMEGTGVYKAANRANTDWIVVKGICDWADGNKHSKAQPLAAAAAMSLVELVCDDDQMLS